MSDGEQNITAWTQKIAGELDRSREAAAHLKRLYEPIEGAEATKGFIDLIREAVELATIAHNETMRTLEIVD